jgi:nitrate reductase NapA
MTRRVPILHKAMPAAYVEINPADAASMGITNGSKVNIISRRGSVKMTASINGRGNPPKGMVFVPFFDENYLINEVTLDAFCPISKQPDYKKCAVKLERA